MKKQNKKQIEEKWSDYHFLILVIVSGVILIVLLMILLISPKNPEFKIIKEECSYVDLGVINKVVFEFSDNGMYRYYYNKTFCKQVEVDEIRIKREVGAFAFFPENTTKEEIDVYFSKFDRVYSKESMTIHWFEVYGAECIEFYPNAKCSKYKLQDYYIEVLR